MTVAPEVNRGSVSVVSDVLTVPNIDVGKVVVVGCRGDKLGANSEERDVAGP